MATVGVVFAALYLLWAYQQVFHGKVRLEHATTRDLGWAERLVIAPLIILIVVLGVYPKPVLDRITPSVNRLVAHVETVDPHPPAGGGPLRDGRGRAPPPGRGLTTACWPRPRPSPRPTSATWPSCRVIIMLGGAVLLLAVASLVRRPLRVTVATAGTVVVSATALGFALWQWADVTHARRLHRGRPAVVVDGFSVLVVDPGPCAMVLTALVGRRLPAPGGDRGPRVPRPGHGLGARGPC